MTKNKIRLGPNKDQNNSIDQTTSLLLDSNNAAYWITGNNRLSNESIYKFARSHQQCR